MPNLEKSLESSLDEFSRKYGAKLRVEERIFDVTDCFFSRKANSFKAPASFGNLVKNRVLLFVAFGAPLLQKFVVTPKGNLVFDNGKTLVVKFGPDYIAIACLCTEPLRNVCFHEIYDALPFKKNKDIQGFKGWALKNITEEIRKQFPDFNPDRDTAFMFAGPGKKMLSAIALDIIWLKQICSYGRGVLEIMGEEEARLIKLLFRAFLKRPEEAGYMYGKALHVPETGVFLKRKFKLAEKF